MNDTKTVSGNIVHIQDKGAPTALSVIANITPKQSGTGTPSPSNVRPISGWESVSVNVTGENLFDGTWLNGYWDVDTAQFVSSSNWRATPIFKANAGDSYYVSKDGTEFNATGRLLFFNGSGAIDGGYTRSHFTIPNGYNGFAIYTSAASVSGNYAISKYSGTPSYDYHAYNGHTTTTPLGRTVYGGTLDVVTGVLTVDRAMATYNGSENWGMETGPQYTGSNFYIAKPSGTGNEYGVFQSNITNKFTLSMSTAQDGVCITAGYFNCILGNILGINNLADFKTWLASNNLQIVYPLATPQTYTLTGRNVTLLKDCYAWADSGDISITYETYLINGLFHKILINGVKMFAPNDFTLERSDVYAGEITTCTGKTIADRIGWKYADMGLTWDYLPQEYLETILNLSGVFTITFENEEGVQFTEQCIRKGSTMTGTRYTDNDGNMMWKGVQFEISFINVHN